jgi:phasin
MNMTQPISAVPEGVRDLADKSIEQARSAFEAFWKPLCAAVSSAESIFPEATRESSEKALSYSEANIRASFDHAQKLTRAKDYQEYWQLQNDFVKGQFEALAKQMNEFTTATQGAASSKSGDAPK